MKLHSLYRQAFHSYRSIEILFRPGVFHSRSAKEKLMAWSSELITCKSKLSISCFDVRNCLLCDRVQNEHMVEAHSTQYDSGCSFDEHISQEELNTAIQPKNVKMKKNKFWAPYNFLQNRIWVRPCFDGFDFFPLFTNHIWVINLSFSAIFGYTVDIYFSPWSKDFFQNQE